MERTNGVLHLIRGCADVARQSKLSPEQWADVDRRSAAGEGVRALVKEFGLSLATIGRLSVSEQTEQVRSAAEQKAAAVLAIEALPTAQQNIAVSLAEKLRNIRASLASATELVAATAHRSFRPLWLRSRSRLHLMTGFATKNTPKRVSRQPPPAPAMHHRIEALKETTMFTRRAFALCVVLLVSASSAAGQSARVSGALSGLGQSLSEMADRQAAVNAEIEVAKAKAEIELETHRRKLQIEAAQRRPPAAAASLVPKAADAEMTSLHPEWARIVTSKVFMSWLNLQAMPFQRMCRTTGEAAVMGRCIDSFFNATVAVAE
jgi:hypothetical protein